MCAIVRDGERKLGSEMSLLHVRSFPDENVWTQPYGRACIYIFIFKFFKIVNLCQTG